MVAAIVLLVVGLVAIYNSPAFTVARVEVEGTRKLAPEAVAKQAAIPAGTTLLRLPVDSIQQRLERSPWIATARVSRDFPDGVIIQVVERFPVASVEATPGVVDLLDGEGYVLARSKPASFTVPSITDVRDVKIPAPGAAVADPVILNALKVLGGLSSDLRAQTARVSVRTVDETALFTKGGVEILIGPARELKKKDFIIRRILKEQAGKVVFIDVRSVDRPVWRGLTR